jgi:hypothetical protein
MSLSMALTGAMFEASRAMVLIRSHIGYPSIHHEPYGLGKASSDIVIVLLVVPRTSNTLRGRIVQVRYLLDVNVWRKMDFAGVWE